LGESARSDQVSVIDLSDRELFELLCVLLALLAGAYTLIITVRLLRRSRDGLEIGKPLVVAFGVRLLAALAVGQLAIARNLRGGDELGFLKSAEEISRLPLGSPESLDKLVSQLHTFVFSTHFRVLDATPPNLMLRAEMVLFGTLAVALLSAAVYELAGARAAVIAAWILALEPANVFFSSLLHKEPLMYLAEALVIFGGAVLWRRGNVTALVPMIAGCLIAMATRPYAGWFLTAAAAAIVLHASLTRQRGLKSFALTAMCLALIAAAIPVVLNASSDESLKDLQASQDANAADDSNLGLEQVDYSTRSEVIVNLPTRIGDVIFRPYVWQTENASQQLGAVGTLVVLAALATLAVAVTTNRRAIMDRAGPLVYPAAFMLVAYSLSAGNAGTAYRYRTHLVGMAICTIVILLAHRRQEQEGQTRVRAHPRLSPVKRTRTAT
jgi:hypothetical protein